MSSVDALKQVVLTGLNTGLLLGGIAVQLPQIYKILANKSVAGLSEISWVVQVFSTGAYVAFNYILGYPFMTWGDAFFAVLEYCIIVGCCWVYAPPADARLRQLRMAYCATGLILTVMTLTKIMPGWLVTVLGIAPMPMVIAGRLPQIMLNHQQKHTGQLSVESLAMQVAGNSARIISTLVMVPDLVVLMSHVVAMIFNGIPLVQVLMYWENTQKFLKKGEFKKDDDKKKEREVTVPKTNKTVKVQNRKRLEDD
eukprot:Blabericola_migrator_1__4947@NODE_257_length_10777_cov_171_650047_g215_i0_p5_GENE_NODE_257_length_10777_cov_171_650047_g215_i0NODE_257_length_10777_cov_171_650047_g215_i0_p5_ORF_typecomplete_len254_score32_90PQloop/PF04193_14/1e07PQloop/PF04193_14/3_1e10MtN3_slv/PF03083_16/0_00066MtN3_slv/PF03083_16/1_4ER_lumen_recept/PF00810_18/0_38_NODE_257_length_10777_cov_171_650047_g215_i025503311